MRPGAEGRPGRRAGSLAAAAGLIAVVTLVARIAGFGRWLAFSHSVGATCVGQVYNTANLLPNVLYEVAAGGALAAVAVPLVARALATRDDDGADRIASALLTWAVTVLTPLAILLAVLAGPIASAMLGDDACGTAGRDLGRVFVIVFAPQVVLYGIGVVAGGVLQAHERFFAAALAPLLSSLVVIAAYLVFGRIGGGDPSQVTAAGVAVLAGGTTLGVCALSLPLLLVAARAGIRLRPRWDLPPGLARDARRLAGAGVVALVAQQLAVLLTAWVANHRGGEGVLTVYNYVQALYLLPYAVLAVPLATAAFPRLATSVAGTLARTAAAVVVAGCAGTALLCAVAPGAGRFFTALDAGRSGAGGAALAGFDSALTAFAPGLVGFGGTALLLRAAYARGITGAAAAAMSFGWAVAGLGPLLTTPAGAGSRAVLVRLGVFSSIGMTVAAVVLGGVLLWRRTDWRAAIPWRTVAASSAATILAAAGGRWVGARVGGESLAGGVLSALVAAVLAAMVFLAVVVAIDRDTAAVLLRRFGVR